MTPPTPTKPTSTPTVEIVLDRAAFTPLVVAVVAHLVPRPPLADLLADVRPQRAVAAVERAKWVIGHAAVTNALFWAYVAEWCLTDDELPDYPSTYGRDGNKRDGGEGDRE